MTIKKESVFAGLGLVTIIGAGVVYFVTKNVEAPRVVLSSEFVSGGLVTLGLIMFLYASILGMSRRLQRIEGKEPNWNAAVDMARNDADRITKLEEHIDRMEGKE